MQRLTPAPSLKHLKEEEALGLEERCDWLRCCQEDELLHSSRLQNRSPPLASRDGEQVSFFYIPLGSSRNGSCLRWRIG